jgi:molecular chaperone GrpE (heat shock protein)
VVRANEELQMDIILQGQHDNQETVQSLERVLQLFKERYSINGFREIHLTVTLVDEHGDEVELIDSDTQQPYRIFEVYRAGYELDGRKGFPMLKLVVDNTKD